MTNYRSLQGFSSEYRPPWLMEDGTLARCVSPSPGVLQSKSMPLPLKKNVSATGTKLGDRGSDVRQVQLLLNSRLRPSPNLRVDGHFGQKTYQAVMVFQKFHNLLPDGEVGAITRVALGLKSLPVPPSVVAMPSIGTPWMQIAVAELGVHENSAPGQHESRILEYHSTTSLKATTDETPWCASFVNWVMQKSGYVGTKSAAAKSWLTWGAEVNNPSYGAIVIIKKKTPGFTQATGSSSGYHVGFFVSSTDSYIRILGGNQSNQVKYSNFLRSAYDVHGYRNP